VSFEVGVKSRCQKGRVANHNALERSSHICTATLRHCRSPHILSAIVALKHTTHHQSLTSTIHLAPTKHPYLSHHTTHHAGPHALNDGEIDQRPGDCADGAQCRERVHAERSERESHAEDAGGFGCGEAV
jgi:hypothetical protein